MDIIKEIKENAEVVLKGTLSSSVVEKFYEKAVEGAVKEVSLPGFRKGHVPQKKVIEEVGAGFLWKDAAEKALSEETQEMLTKEEVFPIAPLTLSLKTRGDGTEKGDVDFEIVALVAPTCELADYKEIAKSVLNTLPKEDTQKEESQAKQAFRTQIRALAKGNIAAAGGVETEDKTKDASDKKDTENKEDSQDKNADTPLTDEEAKTAGFENGAALEHFIEGEAQKAVADRVQQKRRGAVAEALITKASCSIPHFIVSEEAGALLEMFKKDVTAQNTQWSDYLSRAGKSEEQVKEELKVSARKRVVLDIIFAKIIKEEKPELTEDDKKKESEFAHKLVEQGVEHQQAHTYAHEQFMREKLWESLGIKINLPETKKTTENTSEEKKKKP